MEKKSAKGTWDKLEMLYIGKTLSNKLTLIYQLYGLKIEEGGNVMAHLNDFNRCINDLIWVNVNYDKKVHYKRDYMKLKADIKEGKKVETSSTANVVSEDNGELLSVASTSYAFDAWILDSRCSFHMCANRDWFDTYEPQSEGEVLMGNNATCKVIEIDTIKIKTFKRIVKTLGNVRHVPELKKNLISLGILDTNGCSFTAKDGVIKVYKGSMVMMRGIKLGNNLYRLWGNAILGGANISMKEENCKDDTQLWHIAHAIDSNKHHRKLQTYDENLLASKRKRYPLLSVVVVVVGGGEFSLSWLQS
ncbi:hypothetical protein LWI28_025371 [Acer negundo]|uniref:Retrovirus-related Pol polyprotein from transposon TNT 1-94-like beta-barrel domain-containing protein n=1 Tax=Acer negundo TaxID=4023 RepID=A0AAD5J7Z4_ACENE|nr:hypothetical protein LWI28_025371 [Acer negundo]